MIPIHIDPPDHLATAARSCRCSHRELSTSWHPASARQRRSSRRLSRHTMWPMRRGSLRARSSRVSTRRRGPSGRACGTSPGRQPRRPSSEPTPTSSQQPQRSSCARSRPFRRWPGHARPTRSSVGAPSRRSASSPMRDGRARRVGDLGPQDRAPSPPRRAGPRRTMVIAPVCLRLPTGASRSAARRWPDARGRPLGCRLLREQRHVEHEGLAARAGS
jgi:hypothetical protein